MQIKAYAIGVRTILKFAVPRIAIAPCDIFALQVTTTTTTTSRMTGPNEEQRPPLHGDMHTPLPPSSLLVTDNLFENLS